jgi:hypothetical protein
VLLPYTQLRVLAIRDLLAIGAMAQSTAVVTPWYLNAISNAYMGSMKATMADPTSTTTTCYEKADIVKQALDSVFASNDVAFYLNSLQQL